MNAFDISLIANGNSITGCKKINEWFESVIQNNPDMCCDKEIYHFLKRKISEGIVLVEWNEEKSEPDFSSKI